MEILTKQRIDKHLSDYYKTNYGERESDVWYEPPAVNVRVFEREGSFISLKCHILTGEVSEYIEAKEK